MRIGIVGGIKRNEAAYREIAECLGACCSNQKYPVDTDEYPIDSDGESMM